MNSYYYETCKEPISELHVQAHRMRGHVVVWRNSV